MTLELRAEGIFEVSIRRDSVYALVLLSHCVIPFVFDVKLARDDSVVIVVSSLIVLMTDQVPNVRVTAAIMVSLRRHRVTLGKFCDVICINPRGFM